MEPTSDESQFAKSVALGNELEILQKAKASTDRLIQSPETFGITARHLAFLGDIQGALEGLLDEFPADILETHRRRLEKYSWLNQDNTLHTSNLIRFWKYAFTRDILEEEIIPNRTAPRYQTPAEIMSATGTSTKRGIFNLAKFLGKKPAELEQSDFVLDLNDVATRKNFEDSRLSLLALTFDPTELSHVRAFQLVCIFYQFAGKKITLNSIREEYYMCGNIDNFRSHFKENLRVNTNRMSGVIKPELYKTYLDITVQSFVDYFTKFPM